MKPGALPEDATAKHRLDAKLAGLTVKVAAGERTSPAAAKASGRWYEFPDNDRGVRAISLDFGSATPVLVVRTANGESRTAIGTGSWVKSTEAFTNGLDHALGVPERPLVAASGAWTAPDVFVVKLVLYETPYYSTLTFRFDGDQLVLDSEHNVSFGPTKQAQLVGRVK
jgi:hypothetical protein